MIHKKVFILLSFYLLFTNCVLGQGTEGLSFFQPADTLHKGRFWTSTITGSTIYSGSLIGLSKIWYSQYERGPFHLFDDLGEWEDMDKFGHTYSAYMISNWSFKGGRWTGMKRRRAMWTAAGIGAGLQLSFEVLDGFSNKWGFSIADVAFNSLGSGFFIAQELLWQDQRIVLKVSSTNAPYPDYEVTSVDGSQTSNLIRRTNNLYGKIYPETFLKDYNEQTLWASINVYSFLNNKESKFPKWLNVAVGYGAQNMFGGFENKWEEDGYEFVIPKNDFPRYRQIYLSLDVDLTRIKTKSHFLKTVFSIFNVLKVPAPTLEFNTLGEVKFHGFYF